MDVRPHLFQPLLVLDAKVLFFIDNQQSEALELHSLGKDRVGPDHDIDGAVGQPLAGFGHVPGRDEPRHRTHDDGEAPETLGKTLKMLPGEQGRGRDHRHLNAGHRRDKRRTQGDFRLAKPHIPADEPIHGSSRIQIGQHILDRI